jgi:capsular polysaccharide transport system ATP-binding protein
MIWFDSVAKRFKGGEELFSGADLLIPSGITVGVLGKPGSGKSTLLKLVAGTELPSAGRIVMDGNLLSGESILAAMDGQMTLHQSLRFLGRLYTEDDAIMEEWIEEILTLTNLSDKRHTLWSRLPADEKQVFKFSVLSVVKADHLVIDGGLAPKNDLKILDRLRERIRRTTVLMASSEKNIKEFCDAGIVIHEKKLHFFDSIGEAMKFYKSVEK